MLCKLELEHNRCCSFFDLHTRGSEAQMITNPKNHHMMSSTLKKTMKVLRVVPPQGPSLGVSWFSALFHT